MYNLLNSIFGGGLNGSLSDWMVKLFQGIKNLVTASFMTDIMNMFSVIACSMIIIYFYMDMTAQASRDMITLEKLTSGFIKLLIAFAVLAVLPELIVKIVSLGESFFNWMKADSTKNIFTVNSTTKVMFKFGSGSAVDHFPEWDDATKKAFEKQFNGLTKIFENLGVYTSCAIPGILNFIATVAGYFISTSIALTIIVKCILSPIAVVQCFEDGSKSSGIKFIKGLIADVITMGIMILVLYAASSLSSSMITNAYAGVEANGVAIITFSNLSTVLAWDKVVILIMPRLAAIGAIIGANKIAKEVLL